MVLLLLLSLPVFSLTLVSMYCIYIYICAFIYNVYVCVGGCPYVYNIYIYIYLSEREDETQVCICVYVCVLIIN